MLAEHQRDAVARAREVLLSCGGVILADEPGLGKSFIAAEIARMEEREGASVEVIVPASLSGQWSETLRQFGVGATILTHDGIINDSSVPEPRRRFLLVDEAHAFRNPRTQRYDALARRSVGARLLLVTATPFCNSANDVRALVDLIVADDALMQSGVPSIDVAFDSSDRDAVTHVLAELVIRRDRDVLPTHLRFGTLRSDVVKYDVLAAENLIESLCFPLVGERAILRQFLWRRLESSEAALLESVRRQRRFYERALECLASGRDLPKREYRRAFAHEEDANAVQQVLFWELFAGAAAKGDAQAIHAELARLDDLRTFVSTSRSEKADLLLDTIGSDPLLVFTGWAATAIDLARILGTRRVALATGRQRVRAASAIEAFRDGRADILVATDFAAEGLNLQRAGMVIHYDLPWNPVKVDQRNGRAFRIGQKRDSVRAIYFVANGDHSRVTAIVARKNAARRELLDERRSMAASADVPTTIRPRVTSSAAIVRFAAVVPCASAMLFRRHKAGIERLLASLANEVIDNRKLHDLDDLIAFEPWARHRDERQLFQTL